MCRIPFLSVAEHGAEDCEDLPGHGDDCDLWLLAGSDEALMEGLEDGIGSAGGEGGHVDDPSHFGTTAPDAALPAEHAGVVVVGGEADQGGDLAAGYGADLRGRGRAGYG